MIETIYTELPFDKITYLDRPEFHKEEKEFKKALTQSMTKSGMKDPVYCWYQSKPYGDKIHILVGNNRMTVAREIGIKKVKAIITNFKADQFPLKGRILKTDEEIKNLFHLPNQVEVRRDKNGEVDQINHPKFQGDIINEYVSTT
jgi:GTPase Era involved in 16S rRNA processing